MKIKMKLTFQFAVIVTLILILFSIAIYYASSIFREYDFYSRLKDRATTTVKLLIEVKEVNPFLLKIIDEKTLSLYDESIRIFNYNNEEIYRSNDKDTIKLSDKFLNEVRLRREVHKTINDREMLGMTYYDNSLQYVLIASAYDKFGIKKLNYLRIILAIGLLISFCITIISGMFYAGRALRPISAIIHKVKSITVQNLNLRLDTGNNKDEISNLASTFNDMLMRLETSFDLQKTFISNASHEFRTPFTSIFGKIELSLMKGHTNDEYVEVLKSIHTDMKKLNVLSENLLELAQANLDVTAFRFSPIRMDELLFKSQIDVSKLNPENKVHLLLDNLPEDDSLLTINGNEQLLNTAFTNLIKNSCKFSESKEVNIKLITYPDSIQIEFIDKGIGIPENEIDKIFEPFYRATNAASRPGHGLGLSIVKKIIEHHKGKIFVESTPNIGSRFIVIFSRITT